MPICSELEAPNFADFACAFVNVARKREQGHLSIMRGAL